MAKSKAGCFCPKLPKRKAYMRNYTRLTRFAGTWTASLLWLTCLLPSILLGQARWTQLSNLPVGFPLDRDESAQLEVVGSDFILGEMKTPQYYPYEAVFNLVRLSLDDEAHSQKSYHDTSSYFGWDLVLEDFLVTPNGKLSFGGMRQNNVATIGELTYPDWDTLENARTGNDVTELLQAEVDRYGGNYLWLYVNNSEMEGDPAPGEIKTLWVTYKTTLGTYSADVRENTQLEIPSGDHTKIGDESSLTGIEILSGLYGTEEEAEFSTDRFDDRISGYYPSLYDLAVTHLAQNGGRYIAAIGTPTQGDNYYGSSNYGGLFYSNDAQYWMPVQLPLNIQINDLSHLNGVFVACGSFSEDPYNYYPYADSGDGVVMFSEDGINWTIQLISVGGYLNAVVWDGSNWIAVGEGGIIWKWQGYFWNEVSSPTTENIQCVSYANNQLVIGTELGDVYSSSDQVSWAHQARLGSDLINLVVNDTHLAALSRNGVWVSEFSIPGSADVITHPEGAYIIPGEQVTLQIEAVGNETLTFQWYEGASGDTNTPIVGATTSEFTTPALQATTSYWARASNALGSDDSFAAILRLQTWPEITDQPDNAEVEIGRSHTVRVSATGENLAYQWFYGISGDTTLPVHGATGNSFSVRPGSTVNSNYWVRVSNDIGSLDSSTARISGLLIPPRIRTQPVDKAVYAGTYSSISISTEGYGLTYQWYNGQSGDTSELLTQSTSSSFSLSQKVPGVYEYWVRVSNAAGYVDSRTIKYEVLPLEAPVISKSPLSVSAYVGASVSLSVTSHGNGRSYQWYAGESGDISLPLTATGSSFSPSTLFAGRTPYWVRVSNTAGYADSGTAYVAVLATDFTSVEKQPLDFSAYRGSGTSYSNLLIEMKNPEDVVSYQWYQGTSGDTSAPISGAEQASYSPDLSVVGNFSYWTRITTTTGIVDSRTALATILPAQLRITEQPDDLYEYDNQGTYRAIAVRATGESLSYQWYEGVSGDTSLPLLDKTSSALYSPFEEVGERKYWVRVSSGSESVDSRTVTYGVIDTAPSITRQPDDVKITTAASSRIYVSLYYSASKYSFQWYEGESGDTSSPLIGADEYDLDISPKPMGIYRYWVRVSEADDSVDSQTAVVTVQPSDYLDWATHFGVESDASGESSSGDGMSNLLKYAMGLNPTERGAGSLTPHEIKEIGGQSYLTFQFRLRSSLSDVSVYVEATNDLSDSLSWETTPVDMGPNVDNGDGTVTYTYRTRDPVDDGSRFLRLVIEETP